MTDALSAKPGSCKTCQKSCLKSATSYLLELSGVSLMASPPFVCSRFFLCSIAPIGLSSQTSRGLEKDSGKWIFIIEPNTRITFVNVDYLIPEDVRREENLVADSMNAF
jgi:hypothetical protein